MGVRTLLGSLALAAAVFALAVDAGAAAGSYVDDDRSRYEGFIEAASEAGLVAGCNPPENNRFCPHRVVSRSEMAILLVRATEMAPADKDYFEDDDGLTAEPSINALAASGVTRGCGEASFCPDDPLTRGQMAQLMATALGWPEQANTRRYVDIEDSPHSGALTALASRGGIEPCDLPEARRLCPDSAVTRDEAVFALAIAMRLKAKPVDSHEVGPDVGFLDSFDELRLWDGRRPSTRNRVGLTDGGYRGTGLKVRIPRGSHFGADFKLDLDEVVGDDPETLFFRYYLRFEPGWEPKNSGKLPGFSGIYGHTGKGGYRSSPSSPGWSARMKFSGNRPDDPRARLGYYVYHLGQERRYGDGMNWNQAGMLQPGEWYCIEGEVQMNTPGVADGALRAWVDGTPAFQAAGIEFRRPSEPEIKVESFWFNVYYGGKPVAPRDLGLTVDEVAVDGKRIGCGNGGGDIRPAVGDVTGNGFSDRLTWGECAAGPCFLLSSTDTGGHSPVRALGNGAWFSLETHRLGIVIADVNGDGDGDIVYRGRCGKSHKCWRVHGTGESTIGPGEDWGDGARFVPSSRLVAGDLNGDGLDDIAYPGECGSAPAHPCWRVHLSDGISFSRPHDWGTPPEGFDVAPEATDMTGDGKADILYAAACKEGTCWFLQASTGQGFEKAIPLGPVRRSELEWKRLFDFDGDGRADIISASALEEGSAVELRRMTSKGLDQHRVLATVSSPLRDILMRRPNQQAPVEALAVRECESTAGGCVDRFLSLAGELATPQHYRRAQVVKIARMLARPPIGSETRYQ